MKTKYIVLNHIREWNRYAWSNPVKEGKVKFLDNFFGPITRRLWLRKIFRTKFLIRLFWLQFVKLKLGKITPGSVLIIYDWHLLTKSSYLIKHLRSKSGLSKIIYVFSNFTQNSGSTVYGIINDLKNTYDQVFAFDPFDEKKYGFEYSRLVYEVDMEYVPQDVTEETDLFYIGQAKDRLHKLLSIFKKAQEEGLKCRFYITGVAENEKYEHQDIIYNTPLDYGKVLDYISKTKGIVDAIQGESSGMTIKTSEAVMLNKKLITTNPYVKDEPYYHPQNILIYDENSNLSDFLNSAFEPYSTQDQYHFSCQHLLDKIKL